MPPTLLSDMASAIALANASIRYADKIDRRLLMDARDRLARFHNALGSDLARPMAGPFSTAGTWGPNGREPGIRDIILTVERIASKLPLPEARPTSHAPRPAEAPGAEKRLNNHSGKVAA